MSDARLQAHTHLTDAQTTMDLAKAHPPYDSAVVYLQAAQVQATMAHALEVRALRELLEERLPYPDYGRYLLR